MISLVQQIRCQSVGHWKWKLLSRVWLCDPMDCSLPGWNSPGQNTAVGSRSLRQGIYPTEGSNPGLPHYRWILYDLSHQGNPCDILWSYCLLPSPWKTEHFLLVEGCLLRFPRLHWQCSGHPMHPSESWEHLSRYRLHWIWGLQYKKILSILYIFISEKPWPLWIWVST